MRQKDTARLSVREIAKRLGLGERAIYAMLEQKIIPGIRIGQRWLITRHAYGIWEQTCGLPASTQTQRHRS
jgi:excisionase family DNA binding protein